MAGVATSAAGALSTGVDDLLFGGAGSITTLANLAAELYTSREMCEDLINSVKGLQVLLANMLANGYATVIESVVTQYNELLLEIKFFLEDHIRSGKVARVTKHWSMKKRIKDFHVERARIEAILHLAFMGEQQHVQYLVETAYNAGWTPLHHAAEHGDVATLAVLLKLGADIDAVSKDGITPLHESASEGHADAAQFLIEHGSVVESADNAGWTPLHHAAERGDVATLAVLLKLGADIHAVSKLGRTPLHESVLRGHAEAVQFLIEHGSVVESADNNGRTALHHAVGRKDVATLAVLLKLGADIHAVSKLGRTPLHESVLRGHAEAVQFLIEHGSVVESADNNGRTALHHAAERGDVATLAVLLKLGADIDAVSKLGRTPLHESVLRGHAEAVQFLIEHGSVVESADNNGRTALHHAVGRKDVATLAVLLKLGADIHAVSKLGRTPLHESVLRGHAEAVQFLIEHGSVVESADNNGRTALHHAAERGDVATLAVLLKLGADIHAVSKLGRTPLHESVLRGHAKAVQFLIEHGSVVESADNDGYTPLHHAVGRGDVATLAVLVKLGADIDAVSKSGRHRIHLADRDGRIRALEYAVGLNVPSEVVARGSASVKTYLDDIARSGADGLTIRCKSCVVGPSEWGKTSLVRSLVARKSSLTQLKDRTIGIDLVSCIFGDDDRSSIDGSAATRQEITFWDFAGQTVYHVAQPLFFSRRTLYVVAVDLEAYAKQLQHSRTKSETETETAMNRFVTAKMWRWLTMIISHQPEAHFVFIGTKADRVDNDATIQDVRDDLQDRLEEWERSVGQLNKESESFNWLVVNATDSESIVGARQALQQTITTLDIGFPMGETYSHVLRFVKARREDARSAESGLERIQRSIVRFKSLRRKLVQELDSLKRGECMQILRTLNDLGDILWYEHDDAGVLKDYIILDPMLVIDLVREVIRHDFTTKNHVEWPYDGRIKHELLKTFELWKDMDKEMMHAFKKLLQYFQLAYPAEDDVMQPESDLIVPTYWRVDRSPSSRSLLAQKSVCDDFAQHRWCWEYELPNELAEIIFDQFAVQSHTAQLKRIIKGACIEAKCDEFATSIKLVQQNASSDVVRIEVSGTIIDRSWHTMRFYLMTMEKVLEGYKGITVGRYIVDRPSATTKEEARHPLGPVARDVKDAIALGKSQSSVHAQSSWMPPDMLWYVNESWKKDILQLQQLQMTSMIEAKLEVLRKLAIAGPARRLPALWMLQRFPEEEKVVLCVMSDLSGRCYHTPIEIETGSAVLAKHGGYIKTGISIISTVASEALSLPLVQTAIGAAKSGLGKKIDHAQQLHNLIERLDIGMPTSDSEFNTRTTKLSPGVAADILNDFLTLSNDSADALSISKLTNLECVVTKDGEYVWAHEHEITVLGDKVTRCESPPSVWADLPEPSPAPSPTAQSPTASLSPSPTNTPRSTLRLSLCVDSVAGLADWDWFKTYCTWQLFYGKVSSTPIASGATIQNADSAASPSWHSVKTINAVTSYDMLHECRLVVQVKRRSRIGWTKLIGQGQIALRDVLTAAAEDTLQFEAFQVPLDDLTPSRRFVMIKLASEK